MSLSREEEIENKKSGEKLFNYIKLFLKMKQHSRQGTKNYRLNESRRRRRECERECRDDDKKDEGNIRRRLYALKDIKTRKYNKRLHVKTQRMGKIIQI